MQEVTKLLGLWREQTDVLGTCFVVRLDQAADKLDAAIEADAKAVKAPGQLGMSARARDLLEAASGQRDGCLVGLTRDALVEAWKDGRAAGQAAPVERVGQLQQEVAKRRIAELEAAVELLQGCERRPGEILTATNDLRDLGCEGSDAADVMGSAVVLLQRRGEEVVALVATGDTLRGQRTRLRERLVEVSDRADRAEDLQRQLERANSPLGETDSSAVSKRAQSELRRMTEDAATATVLDAQLRSSIEASRTRVATLDARVLEQDATRSALESDPEAVASRYESLRGIHRRMKAAIAQAIQRVG